MSEQSQTRRGAATRRRIIAATASLVATRGVKGTSLDEVCATAGVSRSQLYHYFSDKADLVRAVIAHQEGEVMAAQRPYLDHLDTWAGIERWLRRLVALQENAGCRGGCPIGSLASELADQDEPARGDLVRSFETWERHLRSGLSKMRAAGQLSKSANSRALATATMASIQGGLLLTQLRRSSKPLRIALAAAFQHLRSFATADD